MSSETNANRIVLPLKTAFIHAVKSLFSLRTMMLVLAVVFFLGVLIVLEEIDDTIDVSQRDTGEALPVVTIFETEAKPYSLKVNAHAEVKAKWQLEIKSEIEGTVRLVNDYALAGAGVRKGQILFEIEQTNYLAELADAKHSLSMSNLSLSRAQYESRVAKRQFESLGKKAPNELALHLPQVRIAQAAVDAAKAKVKVAERRLAATHIKAPFDGYLSARHISPGQMLMAGESVAHLIGDESLEFVAHLSQQQWDSLEHPLKNQHASLYDELGRPIGIALVRNVGGYLDSSTRHYQLYLESNQELSSAKIGQYVKVEMSGKRIDNALNLPASALAVDGSIFWLNDDSRLEKSFVDVLSREDESVVVKTPKRTSDNAKWRVVTIPISSYLTGQEVAVSMEVN